MVRCKHTVVEPLLDHMRQLILPDIGRIFEAFTTEGCRSLRNQKALACRTRRFLGTTLTNLTGGSPAAKDLQLQSASRRNNCKRRTAEPCLRTAGSDPSMSSLSK